jgi:hypothetical protein
MFRKETIIYREVSLVGWTAELAEMDGSAYNEETLLAS